MDGNKIPRQRRQPDIFARCWWGRIGFQIGTPKQNEFLLQATRKLF